MKILCVIDSLRSGGAQRQLVELGKGFKENGHEVSFLVYHPNNFYFKDLNNANIKLTFIEESNYFMRLFKMRRFIRGGDFDSVLSFLEAANLISTLSGFPYRKWNLVVGERSANPKILKSFKLRVYRWFHLFADHVVANSHSNLQMVLKVNPLLKESKCRVIYNITSLEQKNESSQLNNSKITIVIPASYSLVKNLDGLIEAVNLLPAQYRNKIKINWYGNRDSEIKNNIYNNCYKQIQEYALENIIELHDLSNNIIEEYENSDFVALFSHFEGFPNVINEAMMLRKPIISSAVSDIPNIIKEGENGLLCDSSNINSIKNTLIKAIESTPEERLIMGINNYNLAQRIFNKTIIINNYLQLLSNEK